jgi:environmental stress-induced protein Ves
MPWRNSGGTTTEIVVVPEPSDAGSRFLYRLSIADVAADGPFSRFDGYDRHIMLLEGAGMTLDCREHGVVELIEAFVPRSFSGDWDVHGMLVSGPVRDFNLIVDRARATASLTTRIVSATERIEVAVGEVCLVHVISGEIADATRGDTVVADASFVLEPRAFTRVAIARVLADPRSGRSP